MRAIVVTEHGPPSSMKVTDDAPRPSCGDGEALVKIIGAGVNPVDWKIRAGPDAGGLPAKLPKILGGDLSGIVLESEEGAPFKPGDKVFALTNGFHWDNTREGCYAEVASVPLSDLAAPPATISLTEAAAVPLASLTAWQTLALAPDGAIGGKRVLVHAAAGGVGIFAVQLAKNARGAGFVAATGRPHSSAFLRSIGADEVIDYTVEDWDREFLRKSGGGEGKEEEAKFDVIFDLVAGDAELKSYRLLKHGGFYLHVFNTGTDPALSAKTREEWSKDGSGRHYEGPTLVTPDGEALAKISELIDGGKIKVEINKVLPLEEACKAHEELETLSVRGKIVLKVAEEEEK